jgi:IS5 family transposase
MNILVIKCLIPKPFRSLSNPLKKMYLTRLAKKALVPTFQKNRFDAAKSSALAALVTQIHGLREKLTKDLEEHYRSVQAEFGFLPSKSVIERWGPASETMTKLVHQYRQGRYDQDLGYGSDTLPKTANDWLCTAKKNYTQSAKVSKEKAEKEAQMLVLATAAVAAKEKEVEDAKKKKQDEVALKEKKETDMLKATYIRIMASYVRDRVNEHAHVTWVKGAQPLSEVMRICFGLVDPESKDSEEKRSEGIISHTHTHTVLIAISISSQPMHLLIVCVCLCSAMSEMDGYFEKGMTVPKEHTEHKGERSVCHQHCLAKIRDELTVEVFGKWRKALTAAEVKEHLSAITDVVPGVEETDPPPVEEEEKTKKVDDAKESTRSRNQTFGLDRLPEPDLTEVEEKDL